MTHRIRTTRQGRQCRAIAYARKRTRSTLHPMCRCSTQAEIFLELRAEMKRGDS